MKTEDIQTQLNDIVEDTDIQLSVREAVAVYRVISLLDRLKDGDQSNYE